MWGLGRASRGLQRTPLCSRRGVLACGTAVVQWSAEASLRPRGDPRAATSRSIDSVSPWGSEWNDKMCMCIIYTLRVDDGFAYIVLIFPAEPSSIPSHRTVAAHSAVA